MQPESTASLVEALRAARLLEPSQLEELEGLHKRFPASHGLARELVRRGWLTAYQADQLVKGRGGDLVLGSYVLLDRLGEGGMGQVFKARNWKLERLVALKLVRKERLADEAAVRRFRREIQATAALSHPNIVQAYDADEVRGTHFFVMEHVAGEDLACHVHEHGPLPVADACDCIRQAALGLQHAHEKGMVHRDVKPHNLLRTPQGVVKVTDLGLAQLSAAGRDGSSSTLTQEGVVGTLDYIAPEQVDDSHAVDIRADLYSLGCTFYFLLTGQVPFPGGKALDKLYKHRHEEPRPVEDLRPEVPAGLAAVVRKLMAKNPDARFQTPGELAAVLAAGQAVWRTIAVGPEGGQAPAIAPDGPTEETYHPGLSDLRPTETVERADSPRRQRQRAEQRRLLLLSGAGLLMLLALALVLYRVVGRGSGEKEGPGEVAPVAAAAPEERKPLAVLEGHTGTVAALAFAPDGTLASGSQDRTVRLWDPAGRTCRQTLDGHGAAVDAVVISADGEKLASAGNEPTVFVWDLRGPAEPVRVVTKHPTAVRGLAFDFPSSNQLLTVGNDKTLQWWNITPTRQVGGRFLPCPGWSVVAFSDRRHFAIGLADGTVRLCAHDKQGEYDRRGHNGPVKALAFSPAAERFASGGTDGLVKRWETTSGKLLATWEGHRGEIRSLAFRPDGKVLASASADGTARLWDVVSGKEAAVFGGPGRGAGSVAFSPDGKTLATGEVGGTVLLWDVPGARGR
jgi:serine/threonine protein kinase